MCVTMYLRVPCEWFSYVKLVPLKLICWCVSSCLYIFLVVCVLLPVVEFVYYLKYGIVCVNVCVVRV
jgi:hypothetical protein